MSWQQSRPCALLLFSSNNFAYSAVQYSTQQATPILDGLVLWRLAHSSNETLRCSGNTCDRALCS